MSIDRTKQIIDLISNSQDLSIVEATIDNVECHVVGIPDKDDNDELIVIPLIVVLDDELLKKLKYTAEQ